MWCPPVLVVVRACGPCLHCLHADNHATLRFFDKIGASLLTEPVWESEPELELTQATSSSLESESICVDSARSDMVGLQGADKPGCGSVPGQKQGCTTSSFITNCISVSGFPRGSKNSRVASAHARTSSILIESRASEQRGCDSRCTSSKGCSKSSKSSAMASPDAHAHIGLTLRGCIIATKQRSSESELCIEKGMCHTP